MRLGLGKKLSLILMLISVPNT